MVTATFEDEYLQIPDHLNEIIDAAQDRARFARPHTIDNIVHVIRELSRAITTHAAGATEPSEWLDAYKLDLNRRKVLSEASRFTKFAAARYVLQHVAKRRGTEIRVSNPFKRRNVSVAPVLRDGELEQLLRCARADVKRLIDLRVNPPEEQVPYITEMRRLAADTSFVPSGKRDGSSALIQRWRYNTGLSQEDLTWHLYPSPNHLIPFIILLTYALAANVESLLKLKRSSVEPFIHPALGNVLKVSLEKPRSGDLPEYSLRDRGSMSSGWLLRQVLLLTEPLVARVAAAQRDYVFLCVINNGDPGVIGATTASNTMRRFLTKHSVPQSTLRALRRTRANAEWQQYKDPFRVQRLLAHATPEQTLEYLNDELTRRTDDVAVADVQRRMVRRKASPDEQAATGPAMLPSHKCKNPHDPATQSDANGLCRHYTWPYDDEYHVISLEPLAVARLLRDYELLCEAEKVLPRKRFVRYYLRPKQVIEQDCLPLIDEALMEAARRELEALPPGIPVEAL